MTILPYLLARLTKAGSQLRYLPRTWTLVWSASPGWSAAWVGLLVAQGLLPIATVSLTRTVIDRATVVFQTRAGADALWSLAVPAGTLALLLLLAEALRSGAHWVRTAQSELVQDHIWSLIHAKSLAADLAFYETPEFFNHLHRAREEAAYRPLMLLESMGALFQSGITLLGMAALLIPFGWWLPGTLFLSTVPALFVVVHYANRHYHWRIRATESQRRADYFDWLLTSRDAAAEVRLFGLGDAFRASFRGLRERLRTDSVTLARDQSLAELGAGVVALIFSAVSFAWMGWQAVQGLISLGDLALFYQAFQRGLELMRTLLQTAGQTYGNLLYLGNLFEFLELRPSVTSPANVISPPDSLREGIRFAGVHFRYPHNSRQTLDGLDVMIPAGKIVAIVGPNGSGKSTLIKLLCRFYDPAEGTIQIDGVDLRAMDIAELRKRITVLFQQPVHFNATVRENIALGDVGSQTDLQRVEKAARVAGAEEAIAALPQGYDTFLGKWFQDGAELSVGQWQRIALSRAFLRGAPVILLDEPTSAMDPWAEADWLRRFREVAEGRTAVVVTHRFTTARLADVICVMDSGRIVESGTHEELVAKQGVYSEWWKAQGIG